MTSRRELMRLAFTPGPLQKLAQASLLEEYDADDRVQKHDIQRSLSHDPYRYIDEYADAVYNPNAVPVGDVSPEEWAIEQGKRSLIDLYDTVYDKPWYEDAIEGAKSLATPENAVSLAQTAGNTFLPVYSQLDSENWAKENYDKYRSMSDYTPEKGDSGGYDPLSALMYLPNTVLGTLGMIPGVSAATSGGRKLGKGTQAMLEGLF